MSSGTSFELRGFKKVVSRLQALGDNAPKVVKRAARMEAEIIMRQAKSLCPVDTGTLRRSGKVVDKSTEEEVQFVLGFGENAEAYALAVHEHPGAYDPPSWKVAGENDILGATGVSFSPQGTGPKFLERPMRAAAPGFSERMGVRIQQDLLRKVTG